MGSNLKNQHLRQNPIRSRSARCSSRKNSTFSHGHAAGEVEHQKRLTDLAMADLAATVAETGETGMGLVHEVAKFRGGW